MKTLVKIACAVVVYLLLHMLLVVLFPSYSKDAEEYNKVLLELQEDAAVMERFLAAQEEER
jgi:Tfp pilus assembly protein PilE